MRHKKTEVLKKQYISAKVLKKQYITPAVTTVDAPSGHLGFPVAISNCELGHFDFNWNANIRIKTLEL